MKAKRVRETPHLKLVPPPVRVRLTDLPFEIRLDLEDILTLIQDRIPMRHIAGYGLNKFNPEVITVVEANTGVSFDIDIRSVSPRVRETDAYIDVLFEHYGLR